MKLIRNNKNFKKSMENAKLIATPTGLAGAYLGMKLGGNRGAIVGGLVGAAAGGYLAGRHTWNELSKNDLNENKLIEDFNKRLPKEYFILNQIIKDIRGYFKENLPQSEEGYICPHLLNYSDIWNKKYFNKIDPFKSPLLPLINLADSNYCSYNNLPDYLSYNINNKTWYKNYIFDKKSIIRIPDLKKYLIKIIQDNISSNDYNQDIDRYLNMLSDNIKRKL